MTFKNVLDYLVVWSAVGSVIFSIYVVVVFRTGMAYTARKDDGTLKKQIPVSGYLNMLFLLLGIVGLQVGANYLGLARKGLEIGFGSLFLLNLGHYLVLLIFDTVVIDGLVLAVWRPGFLKLRDATGAASMKQHVLSSIPIGMAAGMVLAALSTIVSRFVLFGG